MSQGEAALYTAVVPTVWSVGVGWVVYACAVGSGGMYLQFELFTDASNVAFYVTGIVLLAYGCNGFDCHKLPHIHT